MFQSAGLITAWKDKSLPVYDISARPLEYLVGKSPLEGRLVLVQVLELQQADLAERLDCVMSRLSRHHQLHRHHTYQAPSVQNTQDGLKCSDPQSQRGNCL